MWPCLMFCDSIHSYERWDENKIEFVQSNKTASATTAATPIKCIVLHEIRLFCCFFLFLSNFDEIYTACCLTGRWIVYRSYIVLLKRRTWGSTVAWKKKKTRKITCKVNALQRTKYKYSWSTVKVCGHQNKDKKKRRAMKRHR